MVQAVIVVLIGGSFGSAYFDGIIAKTRAISTPVNIALPSVTKPGLNAWFHKFGGVF
jgi:hypothetical protein